MTESAGSDGVVDLERVQRERALVEDNLPVVDHVVRSIRARFPRYVSYEELWSAGALGLVEASQRFDVTRGVPFAPYAFQRVRGAIIDAARNRDYATRTLRRHLQELNRAQASLEQSDAHVTDALLAERMGVSADRVNELRARARQVLPVSIENRTSVDTEFAESLVDHDADVDPVARTEARELREMLAMAVDRLPEPYAEIVRRHDLQGEQLQVLAAERGVSLARLSQLRTEAINCLRAWFSTQLDEVPTPEPGAPGARRRSTFLEDMRAIG